MGINIGNIIPRNIIKIEELKGKKIAIDASHSLYQFLSSIRQRDGSLLTDKQGNVTSHLVGLLSRSTNLMEKGLLLCFVFDGKMPEQKYREIEGREQRKQEAEVKLKEARDLEDEESVYKYSMRTSRLNRDMINEAKSLIKALGMPVIQSISEADAQAAYLCKNKDVFAVASSDMDTLLHGTLRLLPNLTLSQKRKTSSGEIIFTKPEIIELSDVLKQLDITQDQLIALGILVGTDYNPGGIKGLGAKKALKLVKEKKTLDKIFNEVNPDFDWKEIYDLFKNMPIEKSYNLEWHPIDHEALIKLLVDRHDFSEERVNNIISKLSKESNKRKQSSLSSWT